MFVKSLGDVHGEVSGKAIAERTINKVQGKSDVNLKSGGPKMDKHDGGLRINKVQGKSDASLKSGVPEWNKYDGG